MRRWMARVAECWRTCLSHCASVMCLVALSVVSSGCTGCEMHVVVKIQSADELRIDPAMLVHSRVMQILLTTTTSGLPDIIAVFVTAPHTGEVGP